MSKNSNKKKMKTYKKQSPSGFWGNFHKRLPFIPAYMVKWAYDNPSEVGAQGLEMMMLYENIRAGKIDIRAVMMQVGASGVKRILAREARSIKTAPAVGGDYPSQPTTVDVSGEKFSQSDMWSSGKRLPQSAMLESKLSLGSPKIVPSKSIAQPVKMDIYRAQGAFNGEYEKAPSMAQCSTGINDTYCKLIPLELPAQYYRRMIVSNYPSYDGSNARVANALTSFDLPDKTQVSGTGYIQTNASMRSTYFPMLKKATLECTNLNVNFPIKVKVTLVQLRNTSIQQDKNVVQNPFEAIGNVLEDMPLKHVGGDGVTSPTAKAGIASLGHKIYCDANQSGAFNGSFDWKMRSKYDFRSQINYKDHFHEIWSANYTVAPGGTRKVALDNYFSLCPQHAGDYAEVNITNHYTRDQIFALLEVEGVATPYYKVEKSSNAAGPVTKRIWGRAQTCPSSFTTRMSMGLEMYVQKTLLASANEIGIYYRRNYLKLSNEANTSEQYYLANTDFVFNNEEDFVASTALDHGYIFPVESQKVITGSAVRFNKVKDDNT